MHQISKINVNNPINFGIMEAKKLTRSTDKVLAGVCGGIAEYFEIDPTLVRVAYAALTIFSAGFPGVLLYIIMLILMPQANHYDQLNQ